MLKKNFSALLPRDTLAGNWADYSGNYLSEKSFVYCGWMNLHDDKENGVRDSGRLWGVQPHFWDEEAVFVHTLPRALGGGMQAIERTEDVIFFRADLKHGLVPRRYVESILKRRSSRHIDLDWAQEVSPKLIWRWVCARTGLAYSCGPLGEGAVAGWAPVSQPCRMPFSSLHPTHTA